MTKNDLLQALQGDIKLFKKIFSKPHESIYYLAKDLPTIIVTGSAVKNVLEKLRDREFSPEIINLWASFLFHGVCGKIGSEFMEEIDVEYECKYADEISEAISRLEDLGDLIDGTISNQEVTSLINSFSQ